MIPTISPAESAADYAAFAHLVTEYVGWCRERFAAHPGFVDEVFGYQSLATELEALRETYGPPEGVTLLARRGGTVCGGGAYRRIEEGICEMKRVFVPSRFAGLGIGRALCERLISVAHEDRFRLMRLDTASLFTEALGLYRSLGFVECPAYQLYPASLQGFLVFMEKDLSHTRAVAVEKRGA